VSILIKGMEMPKRCLDCPFLITRDNDDCILQSDEANAKFESWDDMKASCPLIELPPHGRLADLDKMINDFWDCDSMIIGNYELEKIETVIEGSET